MQARVRASGLNLTVACPGSLQLGEQVAPCPETPEQAEGSVAHIVAMKYGQGLKQEFPVGRTLNYNGTDWTVDDDMVDGALMYCEEAQVGGRFEESISIPDVHPTECGGTPDYWQVWMTTYLNLLKVIDYKFGHRFVEVWEHFQLVAYAAGVARFLNLPSDFAVTLCIVQPRCFTAEPIREWKTTVGEIIALCHEKIYPRAYEALQPNPPTYTGAHCTDCRARHLCKTYQRENASIVDFSGTAEVDNISPEAIGQELRILKQAIKRLEGRYSGLYQHAAAMSRAGKTIAFWKAEPGRGKYNWLPGTPVDYLAGVGDLLGVNVRKPTKLLTPTQAIDAGIDKSIVAKYADRSPGAIHLVECDIHKLRKIFGRP